MPRYLLAPRTTSADMNRASLTIDSYLQIEGEVRDCAVVEALWGREDRPGMIRGDLLIWSDTTRHDPCKIEYEDGSDRSKLFVYCHSIATRWEPAPQNLEELDERAIEVGMAQLARGEVMSTEELLKSLRPMLAKIYANRFLILAMKHPRKAALLAKVVVDAKNAEALAIAFAEVSHARGIDLFRLLGAQPFALDLRNRLTPDVFRKLIQEASDFITERDPWTA